MLQLSIGLANACLSVPFRKSPVRGALLFGTAFSEGFAPKDSCSTERSASLKSFEEREVALLYFLPPFTMATSASMSQIKSFAAWGFGSVFGIIGLSSLTSHPVRGILLVLTAVVLIPPLGRKIGQQVSIFLRTSSKITVGIFAFIIAISLVASQEAQKGMPTTTQVAQSTAPNYEIIKRWSIPNGGEGKLIVIAPEHANETDLVALGEKLKEDTKGDRNATIMVYTDKKAADLYAKLATGLTPTEDELYNTHFVATYDRNINTGYHQLSVFPAGVMSDHKNFDY